MNIAEHLEILLEYDEIAVGSAFQQASQLAQDITSTKQHLRQLNAQLYKSIDWLCGELALAVRHRQSSLYVAVDRSGCKIGYKKKSLSFYPDIEHNVWVVTSSDSKFLTLFQRAYSLRMSLSRPLNEIADDINAFFREYYRSLQEDLAGEGNIIIDQTAMTLRQFATHIQEVRKGASGVINESH